MARYDFAPVGFTCPLIDRVIGFIDELELESKDKKEVQFILEHPRRD